MIWSADVDDGALTIDAVETRTRHPEALDIRQIDADICYLNAGRNGEQVLIRQEGRAIRLFVRKGTLTNGPVRLRCAFEDRSRLDAQLLTLRRLVALWRHGKLPAGLSAADRRSPRWIAVLRTIDAVEAGASQRDIARALFGDRAVAQDWTGTSGYLRTRIRRLIRQGEMLVAGEYRQLLGSRSSGMRK